MWGSAAKKNRCRPSRLEIGTANDFIETWHDEGQTDLVAALRAWKDVGFNGMQTALLISPRTRLPQPASAVVTLYVLSGTIRPDHVPMLPDFEEGYDSLFNFSDGVAKLIFNLCSTIKPLC